MGVRGQAAFNGKFVYVNIVYFDAVLFVRYLFCFVHCLVVVVVLFLF